ncbi:hypothetical protein GD1_179 [Paraglaciecola Antarctic GD virus 1]|nr:hypothetical protein GD1_179 [Paraglaciecola Antarctic GD virus 1]
MKAILNITPEVNNLIQSNNAVIVDQVGLDAAIEHIKSILTPEQILVLATDYNFAVYPLEMEV